MVKYLIAKNDSAFSISLFQILYKTYYRKEYQPLKRFRKIHAREVLSLPEDMCLLYFCLLHSKDPLHLSVFRNWGRPWLFRSIWGIRFQIRWNMPVRKWGKQRPFPENPQRPADRVSGNNWRLIKKSSWRFLPWPAAAHLENSESICKHQPYP